MNAQLPMKSLAGAPADFTLAIFATSDSVDLELLVRPGTDYDTRFAGWCTNEGELVAVNGWLFDVEEA